MNNIWIVYPLNCNFVEKENKYRLHVPLLKFISMVFTLPLPWALGSWHRETDAELAFPPPKT